jgi:ParB/RepB/Spo0J family partition protein
MAAPTINTSDAARHTLRNTDTTALQVVYVPLHLLDPSPYNPRKHFDAEGLRQLADSLLRHGLLQPIVVRPMAGGRYEIVAGERRYRAALIANLSDMPARVLQLSDREALELTVIENLQRQDLDPIEQAEGFRALAEQAGMKQGEIALAVKCTQPTIAKSLGLLRLPQDVQQLIRTGTLSQGHGHILEKWAPFPRYLQALVKVVVDGQWTTRQLASQGLYITFDMLQTGIVRNVRRGDTRFDMTLCRQCPFGAYHATYNDAGHCLRPEHYDELQAAAVATEQQRIEVAKQEAAPDGGQVALMLADLSHSSYERLDWGRKAQACTKECRCRAVALDSDGKRVGICTDPKRFRELKTAEERAAKKAKRDRARERVAAIADAVQADHPSRDQDLLVLLAYEVLRTLGRPAVRDAGDHQAPGWAWLTSETAKQSKPDRADLQLLPPAQLLRLVADAILRHEILQQAENGWGGTEAADWFEKQLRDARERRKDRG